MTKVNWIKAREWTKANRRYVVVQSIALSATAALLASGLYFTMPWLAMCALIPLSFWGIGREAAKDGQMLFFWDTAEFPDNRYTKAHFHDRFGAFYEIPTVVVNLGDQLIKEGLTPRIEYLQDDPFLFVDIGDQRVYLYHWE